MTEQEIKIEWLYRVLERAEHENDKEIAAALRWAIFELERKYDIKL